VSAGTRRLGGYVSYRCPWEWRTRWCDSR